MNIHTYNGKNIILKEQLLNLFCTQETIYQSDKE